MNLKNMKKLFLVAFSLVALPHARVEGMQNDPKNVKLKIQEIINHKNKKPSCGIRDSIDLMIQHAESKNPENPQNPTKIYLMFQSFKEIMSDTVFNPKKVSNTNLTEAIQEFTQVKHDKKNSIKESINNRRTELITEALYGVPGLICDIAATMVLKKYVSPNSTLVSWQTPSFWVFQKILSLSAGLTGLILGNNNTTLLNAVQSQWSCSYLFSPFYQCKCIMDLSYCFDTIDNYTPLYPFLAKREDPILEDINVYNHRNEMIKLLEDLQEMTQN